MKVLTYTSCKEHCDLYTKTHGSIAVNSCQIGLTQKDIILLSEVSIVIYKASIDYFNAKITVLIQRGIFSY